MEPLAEINNAIVTLQLTFPTLLYMLAIAWAVFFINLFANRILFIFGIIPRHLFGLPGIMLSPFLHGNFNHLFSNSIFFLGIGSLLICQGEVTFFVASIWITLISGSLVWLFARPACHIGASAVIIGYWSFILIRAYFGYDIIDIIAAVIGMYYFGISMAASLLSTEKNVSFEGHLAGLIAGFIVGYYYQELFDLLSVLLPSLVDLIIKESIAP